MASAVAAAEPAEISARAYPQRCQQFLFRVYKNEPNLVLNSYFFLPGDDLRRNQRELTHINTGPATARYWIEGRVTNQEA